MQATCAQKASKWSVDAFEKEKKERGEGRKHYGQLTIIATNKCVTILLFQLRIKRSVIRRYNKEGNARRRSVQIRGRERRESERASECESVKV